MVRKFWMILYVGIACLLAACQSNPGPRDVPGIFLNALKENSYQEAYDLLSPDIQQQVGTIEEFRSWVEGNELIPTEWRLVESFLVAQGTIAQGRVMLLDGKEVDFSFFIERIEENTFSINKIQIGEILLQSQE